MRNAISSLHKFSDCAEHIYSEHSCCHHTCVKPEALARPGSANTTCSLLSTGLGNGRNQKRLHTNPRVVNLHV